MVESIWYPSVEDVLAIHDDIVAEYAETHAGVRSRGNIEFALDYIEGESGATAPETIHEKAFHILRLLVANHPFVDANKRTALNTTAVFYFLNGYRLEYDDEIRSSSRSWELMKQLWTKRLLSRIFVLTARKSILATRSSNGATTSFNMG